MARHPYYQKPNEVQPPNVELRCQRCGHKGHSFVNRTVYQNGGSSSELICTACLEAEEKKNPTPKPRGCVSCGSLRAMMLGEKCVNCLNREQNERLEKQRQSLVTR